MTRYDQNLAQLKIIANRNRNGSYDGLAAIEELETIIANRNRNGSYDGHQPSQFLLVDHSKPESEWKL